MKISQLTTGDYSLFCIKYYQNVSRLTNDQIHDIRIGTTIYYYVLICVYNVYVYYRYNLYKYNSIMH